MIFLIGGRREQGKTTLACHLASQRSPRLYIDPRRLIAKDDEWCDSVEYALARLEAGLDAAVPVRDLQKTVDETAVMVGDYIEYDRARTLTVVIDEAGIPDSLRSWHYLFRTAPRQNTTFILTAHRPQDFDTTVRALADYWILFRTTQPHDLAAIADRCGASVAEDVSRLEQFHFIRWDDIRGESAICRRPQTWREHHTQVVLESTRRTLLDAE